MFYFLKLIFLLSILVFQYAHCITRKNDQIQIDPNTNEKIHDGSDHLRFPDDPENFVSTPYEQRPIASNTHTLHVTKDRVSSKKHFSVECPSKFTGLLPHEFDCRKFVNCFKGRGFIQVCSPGTLFNSQSMECDFPVKAVCATANADPDAINEVDGEVLLHKSYSNFDQEEASSHLHKRIVRSPSNTVGTQQYINSGGPQNRDLIFPDIDDPLNRDIPEENISPESVPNDNSKTNTKRQSSLNTAPKSKPKCPPGVNGPQPHPSSCSKFLSCASGRTFEMDCAPGTLFNPLLSVCDFPQNVECDKGESIDDFLSAHEDENGVESRNIDLRMKTKYPDDGSDTGAESKTTPEYTPSYASNGFDSNNQRPNGNSFGTKPVPLNFDNKDTVATDYNPPVNEYGARKQPNENPTQSFNTPEYPGVNPNNYQSSNPNDRQYGSRAHSQPNPPGQSHKDRSFVFSNQNGNNQVNPSYLGNNPYTNIQRQPIKPKSIDSFNHQSPYGQPNGQSAPNKSPNQSDDLNKPSDNPSTSSYGSPNHQKPYSSSNQATPYVSQNQPTPYDLPNQPTPYGSSNQPTSYGSTNPPTSYGSPFQTTPYGSTNQPTPYGSPNQPTPYGSTNQPTPYGSPNQPTAYGSTNQPTPYGSPNQPTPYGSTNQPTPYGSPNQPTPYGSTNQPTPYGSPNQPTPYGSTNQPTPYGSPNQPNPSNLPLDNSQFSHQSHLQPTTYRPHYQPNPAHTSPNPQASYHPNTHSPSDPIKNTSNKNHPNQKIPYKEPYPYENSSNQPTTLNIPNDHANYNPNKAYTPASGYNPSYGSPYQPNVQQQNPQNTRQPNYPNSGQQLNKSYQKKPNPNHVANPKYGQPDNEHEVDVITPSQDILPPYEDTTIFNPTDFRINLGDPYLNETENVYQQPNQDSHTQPETDPYATYYPTNSKREVKTNGPNNPKSQKSNAIPTFVVPTKKPVSRQMIRLRGGSKPSEGFLEMKSSAATEWGLVCDESGGWEKKEADVICQQLGYVGGADLTWQGRPSSSQNTTLKKPSVVKVKCSGREVSILDCTLVKGRTCDVEKDSIWIRCFGNHASQCRPGEVSYSNKCYSLVVPSEEAPSNDSIVGFSQSEAMKHCHTKGGNLLDITSQKENDFISEWLTHQEQLPSIMTSGVGVSVMGMPLWIWEGSEQAFVHQNWWPGWESKVALSPRPQTTRALCVVLRRYYDCPTKNGKGEPLKKQENTQCDSEYFFWDTEDCGSLTHTHPYICKRPVDDIGCIKDNGKDYKGDANVTRSGYNCLSWDNPMVTPALEFEVSEKSRKAVLSGHDHCRNPDATEAMPWCFILTNVGIDKDFCDIPTCRTKDTAKTIEARALRNPGDDQCGLNLFECEIRECIPKMWVCDGQADCLNGFDERNCTDVITQFAHQPSAKLEGHDKEQWLHSSVANCANKCIESKDFECLSFSFSIKDQTCMLSDSNIGSSGALVLNQPDWDYYEMNAKSINCEGKFICQNGKCISKNEQCNGINNCGDRSDEMSCPNLDLGYEIRLAGTNNNMSHYGRLEIKVFGEWGLVCDDKFGLKDADVVCKELGYPMGASETKTYTQPSPVNGSHPIPILMDEVECTGNETSIKDCPFNGWGIHDCGPEEVAGVICRIPGMKCKKGFWQCEESQECIPQVFLCDGTIDCDDKSDEDTNVCSRVRSTTPPPPKESVQKIAKKKS